MLENLNKTPRNFYGGTHRNFQVKRISKLHFLRSTLQALPRLALAAVQKTRKSSVLKKLPTMQVLFFKKRFYYDPKSKTIKPLTQA